MFLHLVVQNFTCSSDDTKSILWPMSCAVVTCQGRRLRSMLIRSVELLNVVYCLSFLFFFASVFVPWWEINVFT